MFGEKSNSSQTILMIADSFTIRGTNSESGRRKNVHTTAYSEEEAIEYAKEQGLVEPFEISKRVPEPTEAQLSYARDLGAMIPPDATREDLRAIISKRLEGGGDPHPDLREFAKGRGVLFSRFVGKIELYNRIHNDLDTVDQIAFFAFCVYRWVSDDRRANMDVHPLRQVFYSFAEKVQHDERWLKSFYGNYDGENIRFFGKIITDNGWEMEGGSTNTIAYKEVCTYLAEKANVSVSRKTKNFQRERKTATAKNQQFAGNEEEFSVEGCGCLIVLIVIVIIAISWWF